MGCGDSAVVSSAYAVVVVLVATAYLVGRCEVLTDTKAMGSNPLHRGHNIQRVFVCLFVMRL